MGGNPSKRWVGAAAPRVEDEALLRGRGVFVDDIAIPGCLEAAFVRSPVAHGRILRVDVIRAAAMPGVRGVFAYQDLRKALTCDLMPLQMPAGGIRFEVNPPVLAESEVCYVGEPIVLVVAESRHLAEDACACVELEIEPLPAVVDPVAGLAPDAPRARLHCPDNLVARTGIDYGDVEAAFVRAAHVVRETFRMDKGGGHSIEPRGLVARYDPVDRRLTVWDSTQMPHRAKTILVEALGLPEDRVRVVAPDVGGGFGPKAVFHPEELAIPAAAILLDQPVKWIEDRYESFVACVGERQQVWFMEAAFDADGRLLGVRGRLCYDHGAATPYGIALPFNAATNFIGPYVLPAFRINIELCLTNKTPAAPTRGAGRPQGTFVMERLLDRMADRLGLARDEIRRRNLITPGQMPYSVPVRQRDGTMMQYDTGDYPACQQKALELADWRGFRRRQAQARAAGRLIGLGLANYVEATGRGPFESVSVAVLPSGLVRVCTGATAQGQGVMTMIAQIVADALGLTPAQIQVVAGDTDATPAGLGAFASRQTVTAGNSALAAAQMVADKAKAAAAAMLEASIDDLEIADGRVFVTGVVDHGLRLRDIAKALAGAPGYALPANLPPGLSASNDFMPTGLTYTNGAHVAEVEVDPGTGRVSIRRYVVVHDCGQMINPMLVEGQIVGGVVHGVGATLFEEMLYDDQGQPLTATYADYLLPTSDVAPRIEIHHFHSPTPLNPLGVKGAAESGTIGAPAAIAAAVEDALREYRVKIADLPIRPTALLAQIGAAP